MNTYEKIRWNVREAMLSGEVAAAAGVPFSSWNHHIFDGVSNFIKGKNRGRIPFLSWQFLPAEFAQTTGDGGMETFSFVVRADVGGRGISGDIHELTLQANKILRAFLAKLSQDDQWKGLEVTFGELTSSPWGAYVEATVNFEFPVCGHEYSMGDVD